MAWLSDLTEEWKKAKTPERVFIVGASVGVVAIALYLHNKSSAPSQPGAGDTSGLSGVPANFRQGGGGGGGGTPGGTPGGVTGGVNNPPASNPKNNPPVSNPIVKPVGTKQPTTVTRVAATTTHAPSKPVVVSRPPVAVAPPKPRYTYTTTGLVRQNNQTGAFTPSKPTSLASQQAARIANLNR
jgi:hypothetical protein